MTGFELGNCRRYGWNPIVVVFNNASWEMPHVFQPESAFNNLDDWRFAKLAAPSAATACASPPGGSWSRRSRGRRQREGGSN